MAHTAPVPPPLLGQGAKQASQPRAEVRFDSLVLTAPESVAKERAATLTLSLIIHALLVVAIILIPLLTYDALPAPGDALRAFFVAPGQAAPPPPPPPPPAAGVRPVARTPVAARPADQSNDFVAPVEMPEEIKPEEGLDLGGVEGGVPGGVEGGIPGGVVGGIVGGIPTGAPPPVKAVRVGGNVKAPKLVHQVQPVYPDLAIQARLSALVIMEALVDTAGRVKTVRVLRGAPLFDDAAMGAVRQWRYQPLLLNGIPTEFILTVTVNFNLATAPRSPQS
ncbi:MAG: energy transducer TonB [Vicinamibacteria bacterium]